MFVQLYTRETNATETSVNPPTVNCNAWLVFTLATSHAVGQKGNPVEARCGHSRHRYAVRRTKGIATRGDCDHETRKSAFVPATQLEQRRSNDPHFDLVQAQSRYTLEALLAFRIGSFRT